MSCNLTTRILTLAGALTLANVNFSAIAFDETIKEEPIERIAIVGSRAAPRSVGESPVPIDIIGGDELSKNASSDMLEMLNSVVPSLTVLKQPVSDAAAFIRPVNLRGLSSDSTLILLNGKRRHRASVIAFQGGGINDGAQGPDISVIPSIALKQIEVLRDGAAAQYGSDAIAGVMNFVLKDDNEGGSVSVRRGEFYQRDGEELVFDANIGMPFTENGFANFSFQLKNVDGTSRSVQRPDAQALIDAGNTEVIDLTQVWGNLAIDDDITLFGNIGLELDENKEFYLFGNYSERTVTGGYFYRNPQNRSGVYTDKEGKLLVGAMDGNADACPNIDITAADVRTQQNYIDGVLNNDNCWAFNEMFAGGYTPNFIGDINDTSITAGLRGDINGGFLDEASYDISASVGRNKSSYTLANTVNPSMGAVNQDQPGHAFNAGAYIQLEKAFNVDLVQSVDLGLADFANVATGLEWRQESFEIVVGEQASWQQGILASQGFSIGSHGFSGFSPESARINTRKSVAAYIDVEANLTESFLIGGALRYENFSSFGSTTNYKLTAQLALTDELSLRASHSTGFRAPTVGQANVVNTQTTLVNGELIQTAIYPATHPVSLQLGSVELAPEKSKSYAMGMVYQYNELFMTIDAYRINVSERLAQTDKISISQTDVDALQGQYANPEYLLGGSVSFFANDFDTQTQGIDVVANYAMDLLQGDTRFSLAYNYNETKVEDLGLFTSPFKVRLLEDSLPKHRGTFTIAQSWQNISLFVRANYFGSWFATHAGEPDLNSSYGWSDEAGSSTTFDAQISYIWTDDWTLSLAANNVFDRKALKLQQGENKAYSYLGAKYYETGPFDFNGGFYYLKATYSF